MSYITTNHPPVSIGQFSMAKQLVVIGFFLRSVVAGCIPYFLEYIPQVIINFK